MNETSSEQVRQIAAKIESLEQILASDAIQQSRVDIPGCEAEVQRMSSQLEELRASLGSVPPIEIVVLGPSRHGKSTLLNALAGESILPTSDIKPCTASIVSLKYDPAWSVRVKFVTADSLKHDWRTAVNDAKEHLQRLSASSADKGSADDEAPDDPKYLHSVLQRYLQLFQIDPNQDPLALIEAVEKATIPSQYGKLLGKNPLVNRDSLEGLKSVIEKYLSTKDVWWTLVESCEIAGPFAGWHEHLRLVDLPGTNDTNPHRTAITNKLRDRANAVAIVTSDSNLGIDIESWLQNSTVLADFLEAKSSHRQRLFIVRTKFDSYHPKIDPAKLDDISEEEEERLEAEAIEAHKQQQKQAYHEMLREMVLPMLPDASDDPIVMDKRQELLERVSTIEAFFVFSLRPRSV